MYVSYVDSCLYMYMYNLLGYLNPHYDLLYIYRHLSKHTQNCTSVEVFTVSGQLGLPNKI